MLLNARTRIPNGWMGWDGDGEYDTQKGGKAGIGKWELTLPRRRSGDDEEEGIPGNMNHEHIPPPTSPVPHDRVRILLPRRNLRYSHILDPCPHPHSLLPCLP
ncbi:hypothetical protein OIDMADRAFT_20612 [Oidiodendron maius Zn]|uniref:Uncharacterized protein n=1 Tax=Oidiodendron maius (strain Zn) TaxID=913774 RepID=A0A0C3GN86_OIDMZ|nr:hypothetical protein OIDMADRAFT_20612 [Oidiodendron maius Zn]